MGKSRRDVLKSVGASIGGTLSLSMGYSGPDDRDVLRTNQGEYQTPSRPEWQSTGIATDEAYGTLELGPERRYWPFEIDGGSERLLIEYEITPTEGSGVPDVLAVEQPAVDKYQTRVGENQITTGPLVSLARQDLGLFGERQFPDVHPEHVHLENFSKLGDRYTSWENQSPNVGLYSLECLNSTGVGPVRRSKLVESGDYCILFDWTDEVMSRADTKSTTVDVSVRAVEVNPAQIQEESSRRVKELYSSVPTGSTRLLKTATAFAEAICLEDLPVTVAGNLDEAQTTARHATELQSSVAVILAAIDEHLGYRSPVLTRLTQKTARWTAWAGPVLPIASSTAQLVQDACAVQAAPKNTVTDRIEEMLLSLGILIIDLAAVAFGVAGRAASLLTKVAHNYLLGYIARTVGVETYVVLLREVYTLTRVGISEVIGAIKQLTREIGEETNLLRTEEIDAVESLDHSGVQSPSFDFDLFDPGPECLS